MNLKEYKVEFKNLSYFLNFGLEKEERKLGQRIYIDIVLILDPTLYPCDDDISTVCDYRTVNDIVKLTVHERSYKLLENMAREISRGLLAIIPVKEIEIQIKKPSVPISSILDHVQVQMRFTK